MACVENYQEFLKTKKLQFVNVGIEVSNENINPKLFDFQKDIVRYALKKGRAAIFADTGLGKTFMQLEWARLVNGNVLIIAPLTVAKQTSDEARKLGISVNQARHQDDVVSGINVTNYEMLHHFEPSFFDAVVLDESSILKSLDGKTRTKLIDMFQKTKYRLCCTATPAPNDISEIGNHAEFLSIMPRNEMLAAFFVHDDNGWRLKGHALKPFFKWMASWAVSLRRPSDLGYSDDGYVLPPLSIEPLWVESDITSSGRLFFDKLHGLKDRIEIRKGSLEDRCNAAAELINNSDEQWIVWCGLNDESDIMAKLLDKSQNIQGSDTPDFKSEHIDRFKNGNLKVLITKPKIAGFGMNLQNCHNMAFIGLSDSWESYYQCIRRCYRFGQDKPVNVVIVLSEHERSIYDNVLGKEDEAKKLSNELINNIAEFEKAEIHAGVIQQGYKEDTVIKEPYTLMLGDSTERLSEVETDSIHLSVYSPPFSSLYTYSPSDRDLGNSKSDEEFLKHYSFIVDELLRVTKPGRNTCVHCSQIPLMLGKDGVIGMKDFRGDLIKLYIDRGWIYHGEVCIDKNPQAQAIRNHSKALLFNQLRKDSSWVRPALADYILVFRKPGENLIPIKPNITNNQWIEWAHPIWYGINESDTLQVSPARESSDERHICPLQLSTIERCISLWSNENETVLSPFAGIGSEGYVALKNNRRFIGCELKESYFKTAIRNLDNALCAKSQQELF